jgi:GMP reductase
MRIEEQVYYDYDDVLIKPKRSFLTSRKEVDLIREFTFLHSKKQWKGIPIIASNMDVVGTWKMRNVLAKYSMPTMMHKFYTQQDWAFDYIPIDLEIRADEHDIEAMKYINAFHNYTVPSFGIRPEDTENMINLINNIEYFPTMIAFDIANGYIDNFVTHIKKVRDIMQDKVTIIAGNVATPEGAEALVFAGADIVKCGIGPSKICDTRIKTGVGIPQLSAVIEVADAVHGLGAHIIADGGIKQPSDTVKAFGAGADFVMVGSMFAGHEESGGEVIERLVHDGFKQVHLKPEYSEQIEESENLYTVTTSKKILLKEVYGMSSQHAMQKHYGKKAKYRAAEGNYQFVEYRGAIENTVNDILGSLRSACTYVGARRLKDLSKCTTFIKVNRIK